MQGITWVITYHIALVSSIVSVGFLTLQIFNWPASMELNVIFSSMNMLAFATLYTVYEVIKCVACKNCRRKCINNEYNSITKAETDMMQGRPRLLMQDVWILVYGVGLCFFVISYVSTCMDLLSIQFFAYGLVLLVASEIVGSHHYDICTP